MGLFDKLKDVVNTAGDSINKAMEKAINTIDSNILSQEEQWYYDMIVNALLCVKYLQKEHIKTLLLNKANKVCDEAILDKMLEKFETEEEDDGTWYRLSVTQHNRAVSKGSGTSCFKGADFEFLFDGFEEQVLAKFASIYEVVRENPTEDVLRQGISKIKKELCDDKMPAGDDFSYSDRANIIIGAEIKRRFYIGDGFLSQIFIDRAIRWLMFDYEHNRNSKYIDRIYAFALHALHYEKADKKAENYATITKEDCRKAAEVSAVCQDEIKAKPFDKEEIFDRFAYRVANCDVLPSYSDRPWEKIVFDTKLADAVCFQAWQEIVDAMGKSADNIEDAVNIIHAYISNASDGEYEESEGHTSYNYNMLSDEQREGLGVVDND